MFVGRGPPADKKETWGPTVKAWYYIFYDGDGNTGPVVILKGITLNNGERRKTYMVIAVAIQKGGTGKSTTAAALAQATAAAGKKALAIDLDSQGNTSFFLSADTTRPGSYELLTGEKRPQELMQETQKGLYIIPASWNLATVESYRGSARRLQKALEPIKKGFDIVIIDTPPNAGELQYNAMQTADILIIPLQCDIVSLQGLYLIHDTAAQIRATNPALKRSGIILTRYNARSTLARQMQEQIVEKAAELGIEYLGAVREAVAIREAQTLQEDLYTYAPNSKPAQDYKEILKKIIGG